MDAQKKKINKNKEATYPSDGNYQTYYTLTSTKMRGERKVLSFWTTLVRRGAGKRKSLKRLCHIMKLGEYLYTGVEGRGRHRQTD